MSQSVEWNRSFRYKYAVEMLMFRRANAGLSRPRQQYLVIADQVPVVTASNQHRSNNFCRGTAMPWNATSKGEIFVIDEDASMREKLSKTMQERGYDVISFADGAALLSHVRARTPACIFLEAHASDQS